MNQLSHFEDIAFDSDLWLGLNLLDVEAFRQYKKSITLQVEGEEYYSQVINQYEKIDSIITEGVVDAGLIHELYEGKSVVFEREFAD